MTRCLQTSVLALVAFLFISYSPGDTNLNPQVVRQVGFTVVGIAVRTSNAKEMTTAGAIGKQWGRFLEQGVLAQIPNKADKSMVAVYTDYASDKNGEYTYLLGARVSSDRDVPRGMVAKKIPTGRYAVFTSEKGPAPKVVPETWMRINSLPRSAVGGEGLFAVHGVACLLAKRRR